MQAGEGTVQLSHLLLLDDVISSVSVLQVGQRPDKPKEHNLLCNTHSCYQSTHVPCCGKDLTDNRNNDLRRNLANLANRRVWTMIHATPSTLAVAAIIAAAAARRQRVADLRID